MRAVTIQEGKLVVDERPDPEPARGELGLPAAAHHRHHAIANLEALRVRA